MSNQEQQTEQEAPAFRLQRVYIKDISFENPNSPEIFEQSGKQQPKVEMSLNLGNRQVSENLWEVAMKVGATVRATETDELMFHIEVEQAGVFYLHNIPEEHVAMVLDIECPTILFPYTRQIVSQVTVDGGYLPFILEPVNFRALFESKLQQAAQGQTVQ